MKKLTLVCFSFVVLGLVSTANAKIDPETAIGIWLLDESDDDVAKDISGNENHGTLQGDPEWVDGKFGSALSFNGQNQRVVIPDSDSLDLPEAWTITAWIFVSKSETGYGHILGKRNAAGTNYAFRTNQSGTGWESYFWKDGAWKGLWGQGNVKKDVWLYMTAVYDGENTITIYENGTRIGSGAVGAPPPATVATVHLGGWEGNASELLDGILDEVALFSVALTVDDIKDLMDNGIERALGITPVERSGKAAYTWGSIKAGYHY